jgi:hypothetical protein
MENEIKELELMKTHKYMGVASNWNTGCTTTKILLTSIKKKYKHWKEKQGKC